MGETMKLQTILGNAVWSHAEDGEMINQKMWLFQSCTSLVKMCMAEDNETQLKWEYNLALQYFSKAYICTISNFV